jgi:membrane-associated phospholipid phosphatase
VRSSEWVAFVYFGAMGALAWIRPLPASRRLVITLMAVVMNTAIFAIARAGGMLARDWSPLVVILVGYFVSGRFFVHPSRPLEAWLTGWDRRVLGDPATRFSRWPRSVLAYLELVYMGCFLLIPFGFAALALTGRSSLANRYWTMVIGAEFGAFAPLSLIQTRPPWAFERAPGPAERAMRRFALRVVAQFTIRANTFPSGHVAGSLAVAFAVMGAVPWAGAILLGLALSISLACVVGRYHYVIDVVAGAVLAVAIWGGVMAAGL